MPSQIDEIKCALSESYLKTISSVTEFPVTFGPRQEDLLKVDAKFTVARDFGPQAKKHVFTVYIQLKATSTELTWKRGKTRFEIEVDLYDMYRTTKTSDPMYLVVLLLPGKHTIRRWHSCTSNALSIKGCAYWVSLYGAPEKNNEKTVTIAIRRKHMLTAKSLEELVTTFAMTDAMVPYAP